MKVGESPLGEEDELGRGEEQSPRASMGVGQAHGGGEMSPPPGGGRDEPGGLGESVKSFEVGLAVPCTMSFPLYRFLKACFALGASHLCHFGACD